jgi:hypothetical protein
MADLTVLIAIASATVWPIRAAMPMRGARRRTAVRD